jgi:hypothetical protein
MAVRRQLRRQAMTIDRQGRDEMADGGGSSGVLGVLVGALLVVFVGVGVLMATGKMGGGGGSTLTIKMPSAN